MSADAQAKAGRSWEYDDGGVTKLTVPYRVVLDSPVELGHETTISGLPSVGSAHTTHAKLKVKSISVREGSGGDKCVLTCDVNYEKESKEDQSDAGSQETPEGYSCEEWGWSSGTDQKELTEAANSTAGNRVMVQNSAGDPFDSVPKVSVSAPIFTKVMKFSSRQTNAMTFDCCVNDAQMTIGSMTCPAASLLCSVSEKLLFGDEKYRYQYTVQLKFKSNPVIKSGDTEKTDIGWDVAIVDCGMRALTTVEGSQTEVKRLIRVVDKETGKRCVVTSPALLDGNGHVISETDPDQKGRNLVFQAYSRKSFPSWFYSEPTIQNDDDDDDEQGGGEDEEDSGNNGEQI